MSAESNTPPQARPSDRQRSPARLVHELANLLDGSLRNVGLAMSDLHDAADAPHGSGDAIDDALLQRLDTAQSGMKQMAMLLRQWMHLNRQPRSLYRQRVTLGRAIDQAVRLLSPAAAAHNVDVITHVSDQAQQLPIGSLFPIIANALRNSLEALASRSPARDDAGTIELDCRVDADQLLLTIDDNGTGLDPAVIDERGDVQVGKTTKLHGMGIGLDMSRQIASAAGGTIELVDRKPHGARFVLRCPVNRITPVPDNDIDDQ